MVSMEFMTFPFSCEKIKRTHSDATYSDIYTSSEQIGIRPLLHVFLRPGSPFATFSFGTRRVLYTLVLKDKRTSGRQLTRGPAGVPMRWPWPQSNGRGARSCKGRRFP